MCKKLITKFFKITPEELIINTVVAIIIVFAVAFILIYLNK